MSARNKFIALTAGFWREHTNTWMCTGEDIETFADLIRADEREKVLAGERIRIGVRLDTLKTAIALLKAENTELKDELKVRGNT